MLIEKIVMKNFRCHSDKTIEFSKGINLILGENGAGKSSILETIGLALLGETNSRDNKDQIKIGEKKALIEVHFIGNDENKYRVERTFSSSGQATIKMFLGEDNFPILQKKDEITAKCGELFGFKSNADILYKHVVTAYQNKFINMFAAGKENETTINSIFNTEVYRRIAEQLKDTIKGHYDYPITFKSGEIAKKQESLGDIEELNSQTLEIEKEIKNEKENISQTEALSKENALKIDALKALKNLIDSLEFQINEKRKSLKSKHNSIESLNDKISSAEKSKLIVEENISKYNEYELKYKDALELEKHISALEKKNKKRENLQKNLNISEQNIIKYNTEKENLISKIDTTKINITGIEEKINALKNENSEFDVQFSEILNKYEKQKEINQNFKDIIKKYENTEKILFTKNQILEGKKIEFSIEEIDNIITSLEKENNSLAADKTEMEKLQVEINTLKSRLDDNNEAGKQLAGGSCPILKEQCKNISNYSVSDYFTEKAKEIQTLIDEKQLYISQNYSSLAKQIKEKTKEISEKKVLRKNTFSVISEREELQKDINNLLNEKNNIQKEIANLVLKHCPEITSFNDNELILTNLNKAEQELSLELNSIKIKIDELKKNIKNHTAELKKYNSELASAQSELADKEVLISKSQDEISKFTSEIEELNSILSEFEKIKAQKSELNNELELLKPAYDLYTANIKTSESLPKLNKEKADIEKEITELDEEITNLDNDYQNQKSHFSQEELDKFTNNKIELEKKLKELHENVVNLTAKFENNKSKIEQFLAAKKDIEKLEKEINFLKQKKELAEKFRTNLNDMGKQVASRMLNKIELTATDNYRMLSGKNESIKWETTERNYRLKLLSETGIERNFEMLSGGEQVTIALAMRAALASNLTESNFAIFDEPTINLDNSRKAALSESLHKILSSVKQSIIVTHDAIFQEFAEKVHYL